jgi:hypothetical protein
MVARSAKPRRVYRSIPDAEKNLRHAISAKTIGPAVQTVSVSVDDVYSVLDELRATRARNACLLREMSQPLPGMEG